MEAKIIANAFNALSGDPLRQVYSMYVEMTSLDLFGSAWNKELEQAMTLQTKKLATQSEEEIRLQLVLQLLQTTNQRVVALQDDQSYELACARLLGMTGATTISTLIQQTWQMLTKNIAHEWPLLSQMERSHFAKDIFNYVATFSVEKRDAFQQSLDMPQMTSRHLEQALSERGVMEALQMIDEQFSLDIYPTVINSIADLEKIDIPLGFFTLVKHSAVAAVSGSFLTYRISNKSMKRQMIPAILVQVALPYMLNGQPEIIRFVQQRWENIIYYYEKLSKALTQIDTQHQDAEMSIQTLRELTRILSDKIQAERQQIAKAQEQTYDVLTTVVDIPMLEPYASIVRKLRADIDRLDRLQDTTVVTYRLLDKVKSTTKKLEHRAKVKTMNHTLTKTLEKMSVALLEKQVPFDGDTQLKYNDARTHIQQYKEEQQLIAQKIQRKTDDIRQYIAQYEKLEQQMFDIETRYPMIRTLSVES